MFDRTPLTPDELRAAQALLPKWRVDDGRLRRDYEFHNFHAAFGWMAAVAIEAGRIDHHPNWINAYNKVSVTLYTHDRNAVTAFDIQLASVMESLAARFGAQI